MKKFFLPILLLLIISLGLNIFLGMQYWKGLQSKRIVRPQENRQQTIGNTVPKTTGSNNSIIQQSVPAGQITSVPIHSNSQTLQKALQVTPDKNSTQPPPDIPSITPPPAP